MLIVLRVGQKKRLISQCCIVPGKSRTPAKFCSSNWEIMCTYTIHTVTNTVTTAITHRQTGLAPAMAEGEGKKGINAGEPQTGRT